ncbi:unnamed protein product [Orchesella dallaii]|uniref:Uncharacterized protein n=1 Tax=Orchesella dallaii TaxID=48710 RepID=A0ABP1R3W5_9HEXA
MDPYRFRVRAVATLDIGNGLAGTVLLCKFLLLLSMIRICLEVMLALVLIFIFLTVGAAYGALLDKWTFIFILILQSETFIRLIGMYIVVKLIEKLKLVIPITPEEFALSEFPEAVPRND